MAKYSIKIVAFVVVFFLTILIACQKENRPQNFEPYPEDSVLNLEFTDSTTPRILFLGDLYFGESYQEEYEVNVISEKGYKYFYQNLLPILDKSDISIANYEASLFPNLPKHLHKEKTYIHYSDTSNATSELINMGIDAISLGNNHAFDYGSKGLEKSMEVLSSRRINFFGAGKNILQASRPLKLKLDNHPSITNIYVFGGYKYASRLRYWKSIYAFKNKAGINPIIQKRMVQEIRTVKSVDPQSMIILFPHWGANYQWKSDQQQEQASAFIEAGADLIIGHGAHRVQEIEKIKGKWVLYSIGNSIFNSRGRFEKYQSIEYSLLTLLEFNNESIVLKCYPIHSNNLKSYYQVPLIQEADMRVLFDSLRNRSQVHLDSLIKMDTDEIGQYFEISIKE